MPINHSIALFTEWNKMNDIEIVRNRQQVERDVHTLLVQELERDLEQLITELRRVGFPEADVQRVPITANPANSFSRMRNIFQIREERVVWVIDTRPCFNKLNSTVDHEIYLDSEGAFYEASCIHSYLSRFPRRVNTHSLYRLRADREILQRAIECLKDLIYMHCKP